MTDAATSPSPVDAPAAPIPSRLERLESAVRDVLGTRIYRLQVALGELTVTVRVADYVPVALALRDDAALRFEQLQDLCGVDYSAWRDEPQEGPRYGVVVHLLSIGHNWRLRLKVSCPDDDVPVVASLTTVWSSANWFEREAFDLFGIIFDGHTDLRRILTDYGFIGHPFRKDFPVSGDVEMRYDPEQRRVIYQPVTIEPREVVPRIVREDHYAGSVSGRVARDPV